MKTRNIEIRSKKHIGTELLGRFKSVFLGHGIEFRDFREYKLGDDAKHIDWIASSKEQTLITRRHQEDRDSVIQLFIDECESIYYEEGYPKNILKNELIRIIGNAAMQSHIRIKGWKLYENARELCYSKNPYVNLEKLLLKPHKTLRKNTILGLKDFLVQKQKKSICIIISDSLEIDETHLKALALLHDVIYLHISSPFENSLDTGGVQNIKGNKHLSINLDDAKLREKYIIERRDKLENFRKKLLSYRIRVGMFEYGQDPIPEIIKTLDTRF